MRTDIRHVRRLLSAFSDVTHAIARDADALGPAADVWRRTGETIFRNPDGLGMRLLRRAYRLTACEMADEFTALDLGLRFSLLVLLYPRAFGLKRLTLADLSAADRALFDELTRRHEGPPSSEGVK